MEVKYMDMYSPENVRRKENIFFLMNTEKPDVLKHMYLKWQDLLMPVVGATGVQYGVISLLFRDKCKIVSSFSKDDDLLSENEDFLNVSEVFSEAIVAIQDEMVVPDANKDGLLCCDENQKISGFVSYYGVPVFWSDGSSFGTVCLFDDKVNEFSDIARGLVQNIKMHIEADLEMLLTKKLLSVKEQTFQNVYGTKTKLLSLISHDIKGSIGTQNQFLKSRISRIDKYDNAQLKKVIKTLGQSMNSTYLTLENLLTWAKNNVLQLKPNKKTLDIVDLINNILLFFDHSIKYKKIKVHKEFYDTKIPVLADKDMLEAAIRNIVSNAIKYSMPKGNIYVRIKERHGEAIIEIEDQGIGMDQFTLNNLFKYDEQHQKSGTSGETSTGIGLMLCKELIEKNNARIEVESQYRKGSKFIIIM